MLGDILREKIIESFSLHLTLCINGAKPKNLHPVRAKSNDLLSSPDDIKDRQVNMHFDELLNQPTNVDFDILDKAELQQIIEEFDNLIGMEELYTALKNTTLKKSPGPNSILLVPWNQGRIWRMNDNSKCIAI